MSRDYLLFLEDIETSCRKVVSYVEGYTFDEFLRVDKTFDATNRNLEIIGEAVKTGENYFIDSMEGYERDFEKPLVCIPLKIKEHVIGVIVIYKLLTQKDEFTNVDYELFTLLAGHAATAVFSSRMYSDSERKLSTIQGFIDLLTK